MTFSTRVLRFKMKDKHAALLRELAREVNFVWNFVNELSLKVKPSAIADIGRMLGKGCYRLLVGRMARGEQRRLSAIIRVGPSRPSCTGNICPQ
ncbi:hypothetical protein LJR267_009723 [Paraburkholderia hospita]|jgi:hypothetical protein|uniref:hypothetical protein n=1 Tax=Paraburkholderia TaxID=1822464 RepID=UPI000B343C3F|nr:MULTISPECIES: hypothetical protein [Paraburkholderia]OUL89291.1 hypothetical protein CA601_16925 [Paraburkholderia hospita]BDC45220.1 hypothetical protein PTKU15_85170 [Paraburkholderia terrae]